MDGFGCSAQEFYLAVEEGIAARSIPNLSTSRIVVKEAGLFSAKREYLRIRRGATAFDICGAPFGGGYFFSWWRHSVPPEHAVLILIGVFGSIPLAGLLISLPFRSSCLGFFALPIGMVAAFLFLGFGARQGLFGDDESILAIPIVGWLYERIFNPQTMYLHDTATMFEEVVGLVVKGEVDRLVEVSGMRALAAGGLFNSADGQAPSQAE